MVIIKSFLRAIGVVSTSVYLTQIKLNTVICKERPIGYSTSAESAWIAEAHKHCSSWEELRNCLEFSRDFNLIEIVDKYIALKCDYNEIVFDGYKEQPNDKAWWERYKKDVKQWLWDKANNRVSRYI